MKPEHRELYEKMGLLISIYRRKHGMTQEELSAIIDVDPQYMSRIERAVNGMSFDKFFAIANALDVEPCQLLDFTMLDGTK